MLLVSSEPERLLPTIRSRCQSLGFGEPDRGLALKWLKENEIKDAANLLARYGGAPLLARDAAGEESALNYDVLLANLAAAPDPLACADIMVGAEPVLAVDCLQRWVSDIVMFRLSGRTRYFPAFEAAITGVARSAPTLSLLRFSRRLAELRAIAQHPVNPRLFAERLALDYADAVRPSH
jgi:DNA polymerase-3 subunit delta'